MARRNLTEEELKEIASKKWKQTPIFSSDEKFASRAKNLTGPRTMEGRMRSLKNLQVGRNKQEGPAVTTHGGYIRRILNEDEADLYEARRAQYLKDFELNESSDDIILHSLLMDEVIFYRLQKRLADHPSEYEKIERPLNDVSARISRALDDLGAKRKQRLKQDEKITTISIATISKEFYKELTGGGMDALLKEQQEEEARFLAEKKNKESRRTIEVSDYEVVEEDEEE